MEKRPRFQRGQGRDHLLKVAGAGGKARQHRNSAWCAQRLLSSLPLGGGRTPSEHSLEIKVRGQTGPSPGWLPVWGFRSPRSPPFSPPRRASLRSPLQFQIQGGRLRIPSRIGPSLSPSHPLHHPHAAYHLQLLTPQLTHERGTRKHPASEPLRPMQVFLNPSSLAARRHVYLSSLSWLVI